MALVFLFLCPARAIIPTAFGDLILTEANDKETVVTGIGQDIYIHLRGNPSTGYSWRIASTNGDAVSVMGDAVYTADSPSTAGGGGVYSFPLRAKKSGGTFFSFIYGKSWDPQSTDGSFEITIDVTNSVPRLSISLARTDVAISWPVEGSDGFYLEGAFDLSAPQWLALNAAPISDGTNYTVTLGASGRSLFFRLRK